MPASSAMRMFLLALAFVMTLAVVAVAYVTFKGPDARGLRSLKIESTPELVERGEYLARHVLGRALARAPAARRCSQAVVPSKPRAGLRDRYARRCTGPWHRWPT